MPKPFIYSTFFEYYTNPKNLNYNETPVELWYYVQTNKYKGTWKLQSKLSSFYVIINGHNVYIQEERGWMFFNIPRIVRDKIFGDHLSIGFKNNRKFIDMHFTIQNEVNGKAEHSNDKKCFLYDGIDIDDIFNLQCQQPNAGLLQEHFTSTEMLLIKEILQKPFTTNGGTPPLYYKYNGKTYRVHIGKRNGKFIIKNGIKIYVCNSHNNIFQKKNRKMKNT
jgi:hypothetical protein